MEKKKNGQRRKKCKVLVVMPGKDTEQRDVIVKVLELNGHEVMMASDPQIALQVLKEVEGIDLIISALNLGGETDGIDFIKNTKKFSCVKIIIAGSFDEHTSGTINNLQGVAHCLKPNIYRTLSSLGFTERKEFV